MEKFRYVFKKEKNISPAQYEIDKQLMHKTEQNYKRLYVCDIFSKL